jgi:hypothetical protein
MTILYEPEISTAGHYEPEIPTAGHYDIVVSWLINPSNNLMFCNVPVTYLSCVVFPQYFKEGKDFCLDIFVANLLN